jgi:DNA-binding response OmpR family regulator
MLPNTEPLFVTEAATSKVILVVEDDDANAELLMMVLSQETSYHVLVARNACSALKFVRQIKPYLFILDYCLRGTNGIALYDQLHAMSELEAIPAIILSASLERYEDEIETRKLPALAKPFEIDEFLALIEEVLGSPLEYSSQQAVSYTLS